MNYNRRKLVVPDLDEDVPPVRKRNRRDRLIDEMSDERIRKNHAHRDHKSKPKGFKHRERG